MPQIINIASTVLFPHSDNPPQGISVNLSELSRSIKASGILQNPDGRSG